MKRTITTIYKDKFADLRDYDVKKCIDTKENMYVKFEEKTMTLSALELKTKLIRVSKYKFKSKFGGKDYFLYSYIWNPDMGTQIKT